MGTISDKLMRIINTKEDIRRALISKGYDVPTSIPFKEYAKMILDLPCNADSFPDIEGIVARYSALGLTNEQMAENPVWKDLTCNGHDLQMKNFAWKGMSGVGGYGDENYQTFYKFTLDDYRFIATTPGVKHMNFTFRVTGLQPGNKNKLTLAFFGTTNTIYSTWNKDGIYTVDADIVEAGKPTYFYNGYGATRGEFTIEILPLYPGALVFDGVDDYGTCDNFPILTKEKGYTVVALRQWDQDFLNTTLTGGLLSTRNYSTGEGVAFEKIESSNKGYWNLGAGGIIDFAKSPFTWQTSKQYNNVGILKGDKNHGKPLCVGCGLSGGQQCGRFAIWELVFLDHDATEEELTKIKDYFIKTYPWLFPDQAWTVVGKTNEDEDRATIANITGNGNDLVLSNFGFAEGSGYGSYVYNFNSFTFGDWEIIASDIKSNSFKVTGTGIGTNRRICSQTGGSSVANWHIKVSGMKSGDIMYIGNANKGGDFLTIEKDGQYHFEKTFNEVSPNGIWYQTSNETNILIEQIPEYEGYLITDGVDDKVQSSSFTMNEDWTIVGDWELLSNVQINCGIVKAQNVYLYNTANGLLISINNPRSLQSFGTKSLHAICSDGRLYDRNWVEYEYTVDQNFEIVESSLNIGFNLNNYTQIAFKNLGIYNNQILSKDDCIKAYNYLQTLKSK